MVFRQFDEDLKDLKRRLVEMGGHVERAIDKAIQAWRLRNQRCITEVFEIESLVNQAHIDVDAASVRLLALQHPVANDLRLVVSAIKINTDLERMVDLAVNIVKNAEFLLKDPPLLHLTDLSKMSDEVGSMVREAIDAFVKNDGTLANNVLQRDDKIDALKNKIFHDIQERIKAEPSTVNQGLTVILIARNLERIADHATNVAEDVIFVVTGRDIRHSGGKPSVAQKA